MDFPDGAINSASEMSASRILFNTATTRITLDARRTAAPAGTAPKT